MVSPDVALDLDIRAGAADLDLDLTHLNVRRVFVGAGASHVRIRLPDSGKTLVEIEAGAADIQITVPQGVAARIDNDSFLNSTSIDSGRFPKSDGEHRSPDYFTAEDRVDIDIEAGRFQRHGRLALFTLRCLRTMPTVKIGKITGGRDCTQSTWRERTPSSSE